MVLPEFTRLWHEQSRGATSFSKVRILTRFYCKYCKERAQSFREEELNARRLMEGANFKLHDNPLDHETQQVHGDCSESLQQVESKVVAGKKI